MSPRRKKQRTTFEAKKKPSTPSRYPTRNTKTKVSSVPADDSLTSEDLSEVPAKCFPRFRSLPIELQIMIFELSTDETFIEAIFQYDPARFYASSSKAPILPRTIQNHSKYQLFPIHLQPARNMSRPNERITQTIYIQAEDILYIPQIHALNVAAFLNREENHVIENLAIHSRSALRLGWNRTDLDNPDAPTNSMMAVEEGNLVRGLKNLKKLYIVEGPGFHLGTEMTHRRCRSQMWKYSLSKVKKGPEVEMRNYTGETNTGVMASITRAFGTEIEMMKRRGTDWNPPELVFRVLRRTLVEH